MAESELPKRCQAALDEIESGKKKRPDLRQIEISKHHRLHRMVTAHDVKDGKIGTAAFEPQDLSVYAEGAGLEELSLDELESKNPAFIGSVSFDSSVLLNNLEKFKLYVVHDPFPDPNDSQHPNHVRIICRKNSGNTQPMALAATFHERKNPNNFQPSSHPPSNTLE